VASQAEDIDFMPVCLVSKVLGVDRLPAGARHADGEVSLGTPADLDLDEHRSRLNWQCAAMRSTN
jgi:hypothetical protein